eukprot:scaffold95168_cov59-Phaeocystis_antarctica.AAC.1
MNWLPSTRLKVARAADAARRARAAAAAALSRPNGSSTSPSKSAAYPLVEGSSKPGGLGLEHDESSKLTFGVILFDLVLGLRTCGFRPDGKLDRGSSACLNLQYTAGESCWAISACVSSAANSSSYGRLTPRGGDRQQRAGPVDHHFLLRRGAPQGYLGTAVRDPGLHQSPSAAENVRAKCPDVPFYPPTRDRFLM